MSLFDDNRTARGNWPCPWCDAPNNSATYLGTEARVPEPGDVGICINCAKPLIYQEHGKPRRPTESEWANINTNESITAARKAVFMANQGNVNYSNFDIRMRGGDE